jgi:hypothetical protein
MQDNQNVQINTQRIPVGSGIGAALLIVILLVGLFLDLPGVRGTAIGGGRYRAAPCGVVDLVAAAKSWQTTASDAGYYYEVA